jgi:RNA polymerase sigma factor (sigma-70 family)
MPPLNPQTDERWPLWAAERPRLVRLCARLTGDAGAAEDLTQETLLEAWRHRHDLRAPERFPQWLSGVARNVCLRWMRQQGREMAHVAALPDEQDDLPLGALDAGGEQTGAAPVEIALERQELAALLDRALDLLAPETRMALLAHYVEEAPLAQIALRMGLRPTAVAMRLRRGRLALRRVLSTELGEELAAFKPDAPSAGAWEETSIWCPLCGRRHLQGRYNPEAGEMWLRCLGCHIGPTDYDICTRSLAILGGVKGYKRAYDRLGAWADQYYRPRLRNATVPCPNCGRMVALERVVPPASAPVRAGLEDRGLRHFCPSCAGDCWESLDHLLLSTPEARAFARQEGRMRMLPPYEVETQGRAALVSRFESMVGAAQLVLISDAETFELLRVEGDGALAGAAERRRAR